MLKKPRGKPIQKGEVRNPYGRPKFPYELQNAKENLRVEFERVVVKFTAMNFDELSQFLKEKKGTSLEMAIAACYFKATSKGEYGNLAFFLDRIVGKPKQQVEVSGELKNNVQVTDDQLIRMAKEIVNSGGESNS